MYCLLSDSSTWKVLNQTPTKTKKTKSLKCLEKDQAIDRNLYQGKDYPWEGTPLGPTIGNINSVTDSIGKRLAPPSLCENWLPR